MIGEQSDAPGEEETCAMKESSVDLRNRIEKEEETTWIWTITRPVRVIQRE